MRVDRCCAGIQPEFRRLRCPGDRVTNQFGGDDSGFLDFATVGRVVSAVDAATRQVDGDIRSVQLLAPFPGVLSIPPDRRPRCRLEVTRDDRHCNAFGMEIPGEDLSDLPASTGDDDAHGLQAVLIVSSHVWTSAPFGWSLTKWKGRTRARRASS